MSLHVSPQVGPVRKLLAAVGAAVRLLAGVGAHVALQQPRPGEPLPAHPALVGQVVGEDVHLQGGHGDVEFVADWTGLGRLRAERLVSLAVAGQVAARGEMLPAVFTFVLLPRRAVLLGPAIRLVQRVDGESLDARLRE